MTKTVINEPTTVLPDELRAQLRAIEDKLRKLEQRLLVDSSIPSL